MLRRSVFLAWLVAIIGIAVPCMASAATSAKAETRVWGFELVAQTLVGGPSARTIEKHQENALAYDGIASGSSLAAEGAATTAAGEGGALGKQGYQIIDGVRRSKAAQLSGISEVPAEFVGPGGRTVSRGTVAVDSLLSPKPVIDTASTPGSLQRWLNTLRLTSSGSTPPPIRVMPGTTGTPIEFVRVGKP